MKKSMDRVIGMFALAALLLGVPATQACAGTTIQKYQLSGDSVDLYASNWTDCTSEYFSLYATTNATRNNAAPTQSAGIYITITNFCTGSSATGVSQGIPEWFALQIQNTRSATLKGNFPMQWYTNDGGYVGNAAVDLQWTGAGNTERMNDSTRSHHGDYIVSTRITGTSANATVSGSVALDGNALTLLNPYARITNSQTGEMRILHYER